MKEIDVKKWKEEYVDGTGKKQEADVSMIFLITTCLDKAIGKDLPSGIEGFRIMQRITSAINDSEKTQKLVLEDKDYILIKVAMEKNIDPRWARNKDAMEAIEYILSFK